MDALPHSNVKGATWPQMHARPRGRHRVAQRGRATGSGQPSAAVFESCFADTLDRPTMTAMPDGTTFVVTGDIPAMWLRDSTAQLAPVPATSCADDPAAGRHRARRASCAASSSTSRIDPYANAFNREPNGAGHSRRRRPRCRLGLGAQVRDRLALLPARSWPTDLWRLTGRTDHARRRFAAVAARDHRRCWSIEQDHEPRRRTGSSGPTAAPSDTLVRDGRGPRTAGPG